jgi:Ni/Co efflux regulator RcnB
MKFASKLVFALTAAASLAGFSVSASADPGQGRDDRHPVVMDRHQMGDQRQMDRHMGDGRVVHHHHYVPVRHHHHHRHY